MDKELLEEEEEIKYKEEGKIQEENGNGTVGVKVVR